MVRTGKIMLVNCPAKYLATVLHIKWLLYKVHTKFFVLEHLSGNVSLLATSGSCIPLLH